MGSPELNLIMPLGSNFGWGVCGRYLAKEIHRIAKIHLITDSISLEKIGDENDYHFLKKMEMTRDEIKNVANPDGELCLESPVLQAIEGENLVPWLARVKSPRIIGYTFFETHRIGQDNISRAKDYYDLIIAGSKYCENVLNQSGYYDTGTVIQGIDPTLFYNSHEKKARYHDQFVIFSGGKFELRKGQDLVIRAFKVLNDRYDDVLLINSWYNLWGHSMNTMAYSPYIRLELPESDYMNAMNHLLTANGINPQKVITLPPIPNNQMVDVYRNSDIGIFPNRCEGGTNLVLMEYMACGKPVIASYSSGHRDILTDDNAVVIKTLKKFRVQDNHGHALFEWDDPSLDEIISKLDWAYWHREEIAAIGDKAGEDLSKLTWTKSANDFFKIIFNQDNI